MMVNQGMPFPLTRLHILYYTRGTESAANIKRKNDHVLSRDDSQTLSMRWMLFRVLRDEIIFKNPPLPPFIKGGNSIVLFQK
jgi:hypothetical protein